jgi:hypothetical protein
MCLNFFIFLFIIIIGWFTFTSSLYFVPPLCLRAWCHGRYACSEQNGCWRMLTYTLHLHAWCHDRYVCHMYVTYTYTCVWLFVCMYALWCMDGWMDVYRHTHTHTFTYIMSRYTHIYLYIHTYIYQETLLGMHVRHGHQWVRRESSRLKSTSGTDVWWRMLTYADVCWRMLTYDDTDTETLHPKP